MRPLVIIVILTFNGKNNIKLCLDSLLLQTYDNMKIIVADNRSTDGTPELVRNEYPSVIMKDNGYNAGFAEGNNLGIELALTYNPKYIMILNDDTESAPTMIEKLVDLMENDESVGICSPKVMEMSDKSKLQQYGVRIDRFGFPSGNVEDTPDSFFSVSGCSMLIREDMIRKIGAFDKEFFIFAEDLDMCWRARIAGYNIKIARESIIYHMGGATISSGYQNETKYKLNKKRIYLRERNTMRAILKNYSSTRLSLILPQYLILLLIEFLFSLVWRPSISIIYPSAVIWNLKNVRSTLRERSLIQHLRRIPDEEVCRKMEKQIGKLQLLKRVGISNFVT